MAKKNYKPTKNDLRKKGREQNIQRAQKTLYDSTIDRDNDDIEKVVYIPKSQKPYDKKK